MAIASLTADLTGAPTQTSLTLVPPVYDLRIATSRNGLPGHFDVVNACLIAVWRTIYCCFYNKRKFELLLWVGSSKKQIPPMWETPYVFAVNDETIAVRVGPAHRELERVMQVDDRTVSTNPYPGQIAGLISRNRMCS